MKVDNAIFLRGIGLILGTQFFLTSMIFGALSWVFLYFDLYFLAIGFFLLFIIFYVSYMIIDHIVRKKLKKLERGFTKK